MKLAIYHGTFRAGKDGTMTVLSRMVEALRREHVEHIVLTPQPPIGGPDARPPLANETRIIAVRSIPFPAYPDYPFALPNKRDVWRALDEFAPDIVQIGTPDLGGLCVLKWAKARGVPAIGAYHTHFPTYLKYYHLGFAKGLAWRYVRWFYNSCARTLVPSLPVLEELAQHGVERLTLWPRGVDCEIYSPGNRDDEWRCANFQGSAGDPPASGGGQDARPPLLGVEPVVFAYAGRLVSEKNVDVIAAAWPAVRAACPTARLLWIGDGPRRAALERLTPDAAFPGYLLGDELARAYASADVLVFCSLSEAFGNVVQEGFASGLPAICIRGTAPGALVEASGGGVLIDRAAPELISRAMIELASNPAERARLAKLALDFAHTRSWDATFRDQIELYREIIVKGEW